MDELKPMLNRIRRAVGTDLGFVVFLGLSTIAVFGIFVPFVGYYWDDWIWKFFSHAYSSDYLLWQPVDRPLAGTLHVILAGIFGDDPIKWQLGNLFFRWANAAAFYWMLRKAFWDRKYLAGLMGLFFLVYPGFSEQWISIAFIHHLVPMTVLWISFGLMFLFVEENRAARKLVLLAGSILLALLVMLTTEYFYGIEIFRVVLLFFYLKNHDPKQRFLEGIWKTLKLWWPYALLSFGMVFWRAKVGVSEGATYSVWAPSLFSSGMLDWLWVFIKRIAIGIYSATAGVIIESFSLPNLGILGPVKFAFYFVLLIGTLVISWGVFTILIEKRSPEIRKKKLELILIGFLCLALGGLPFWVAGLQYTPKFPADRLGLSMMMGWSLVIIGLIMLIPNPKVSVLVLSVMFSFNVAANFISGTAYIQSWQDQQAFWRQFVTRVPALEPGTVVVMAQQQTDFMSDISFMMALNWLYDLEPTEEHLDYGLFYFDSRGIFEEIEEGMPISYNRRLIYFDSTLENTLLVSYSKNGCLYVFDQQDGALNPLSRKFDEILLSSSNSDLIDIDVDRFDNWPDFFTPLEENSWCSYYERAQLELQRGNYTEVASLGDLAFSLGKKPNFSWERAPFIEGYAFNQRWQEAVDLTAQSMAYLYTAEDLLCNVWARIDAGTQDSTAKQEALLQVSELISCTAE